jgi:hypothetical protein
MDATSEGMVNRHQRTVNSEVRILFANGSLFFSGRSDLAVNARLFTEQLSRELVPAESFRQDQVGLQELHSSEVSSLT